MRRQAGGGRNQGVTVGRLLRELVRSPKELGVLVGGALLAQLLTLPLPVDLRFLVAWPLTMGVGLWVMFSLYGRIRERGGG